MRFRRKRSDTKWPMLLLLLVCLLWGLVSPRPPKLAAQAPPSFPPNFGGDERGGKRSSSAIAVTSDGAFCLVVNPDSNSLSIIDTVRPPSVPPNLGGEEERSAEIPVGLDPRTVAVDDAGERAYVANRGSDSVSVVDLTTHTVIIEIPVGDRPYGVVVSPGGDRLYVAEQGADRLIILDTTTFETVDTLSLADRPSGLAITDDGHTLYITHLLTGQVSVISLDRHPIYLPLILKGQPPSRSTNFQYPISNLQPPTCNIQYPISNIQLWPDSNLSQSIVLSPDRHYAYVPHTRSNTSNRALTFDTTVFPLVSLIDLTTQQHLVGQQISLDTVDPPGVGLPFDAAFSPDGNEMWLLNAASNDVTVVDLASRQRVAHIEVGHNPRGIVLSPDGATAYVNNTLAGTVSVIDTAAHAVTSVITVTDIPLPPALLHGKRLFHTSDDPRLARDQWISCNTCHFEGEHDGRTWFFGFAGPRNTTSLMGMIETYPLRWSGEWDESADSEFANRKENFGSGLIDGDMSCSLSPPDCVSHPPNQGRSYDLDCLALFIDSLPPPRCPEPVEGPSPGPSSEAALRGQIIFNRADTECATCHPAPLYTDLKAHDVGTATPDERIGPEFDTPTLRGLYNSAPYLHDGSAATLYDVLTTRNPSDQHGVTSHLTEQELQDLVVFMLALPFAE